MTRDDIIQTVCAFCETVNSLSFGAFMPADGDRYPATDFGTVKVVGDVGSTESAYVDDGSDGLDLQVNSHRLATISVQAHGANALEWLEVVADLWASNHSAAETVRGTGLHPHSAGTVQDVTSAMETGMQPRTALQLTGYHKRIRSDTSVGTVDSVDLSLTIGGATTTATIDTTGA